MSNSVFIKKDSITFEPFAAEAFESARVGSTWVSPPFGDFGVALNMILIGLRNREI